MHTRARKTNRYQVFSGTVSLSPVYFFFTWRSAPPTDEESDASAQRTITMYNGGFTVDDGPFRRLEDAKNKEFLKALAEG